MTQLSLFDVAAPVCACERPSRARCAQDRRTAWCECACHDYAALGLSWRDARDRAGYVVPPHIVAIAERFLQLVG